MITKDNVKEYQIKCYAYDTYEDRKKVVSILESFGQKVYPTSSFKDKYFIEDNSATFHTDIYNTWYYTRKKDDLKTVSVSEFIKLATPKSGDPLIDYLEEQDNDLLTYIYENELSDTLLEVMYHKKNELFDSFIFADTNSTKKFSIKNWFIWEKTNVRAPRIFWHNHYIDSNRATATKKLLVDYFTIYKKSKTEEPIEQLKVQEISLTDIFKYKKTGTLYKVRYADYYHNEFTLATLSNNKTSSWCKNMTYSRLMELFEPLQVTTTPDKTKPNEPDVTTALVSKEGIEIASAGTSLYVAPTVDRAPSVALEKTLGVTPSLIQTSELSESTHYVESKDKTINLTQQKEKKKMAPKIKETASALVADNKEALVNAAELKAGQLINKQVMKLATPKVPLLLQGYMKHPAMQILIANAVGFGLKHYAPENKKLQKLSKLMLNAAAFDTVDSFNLDEMIESILSGIKLPAGVSLDDNDEE